MDDLIKRLPEIKAAAEKADLQCDYVRLCPVTVLAMAARIEELERERDHWKANHDHRVTMARMLIERDDLPLERVSAYRELEQSRHAVAAARLEGWQEAREQALHPDRVNGSEINASDSPHTVVEKYRASIRAMQPPVEWGATAKLESLCNTCAKADVSCPVYPLDTQHCVEHVAMPNPFPLSAVEVEMAVGNLKSHAQPTWPHPDGFAGGLTERSE